MGFFKKQPQLKSIPEGIWGELQENLFYLKSLPAMRIIQMAGPPLERCNVGAYNCSYLEISRLEAFSEILYILMQGTGVGFSVEERVIEKLPRVQKQNYSSAVEVFTIPDSTEGWCDALAQGIFKWFNGQDIKFNYDLIRPAGSILKRKGGRASGPEPLKQLLTFVRDRILFKQGEKLSALDCHDIACMIGKIVQVGGVRRSSEISLSDLNDLHMRSAKSNNWWTTAPWRDMANNSAVFNEKPDSVEFMQEWLSLAQSGSGERGIFNRKAAIDNRPERRKEAEFGTNPCAEIILRSEQFCNLSIVVARSDDTVSTLCDKVRIAAIFGTIQSTLTNFKYISKKWKENCEEERLLGVDITGQMDCPLLVPGAPGRSNLIDKLKQIVRETNQEFAALLGIPESAATTCLKPSGNSSQFLNCSSGIHARYSPFYIRRFRGSILDPVSKLLKDEGVPCHPDPGNPSNLVFEFPVASPKGSWTRDDQTAIDMLENWLSWKKEWAEHSVSCTIYVEPHEWLEVGNWVYTNFDQISGLSFLPKSGGNYSLAPYEEITEEKYNELVASFPEIDWSKLSRYEIEDYTTSATEYACVGGICEL
jgi:ribonucleoside-diphosphate reductase alpha chain